MKVFYYDDAGRFLHDGELPDGSPLPKNCIPEYPPPPPPSLAEVKAKRIAEIDAKTNAIRDRDGLPYGGEHFDMRDTAMIKWTGIMAAMPILTFPLTILTLDDKLFTLADQAAAMGFLQAVLGYETAEGSPLTTGRALRQQVNAAATIEEVDAIIDDRS